AATLSAAASFRHTSNMRRTAIGRHHPVQKVRRLGPNGKSFNNGPFRPRPMTGTEGVSWTSSFGAGPGLLEFGLLPVRHHSDDALERERWSKSVTEEFARKSQKGANCPCPNAGNADMNKCTGKRPANGSRRRRTAASSGEAADVVRIDH